MPEGHTIPRLTRDLAELSGHRIRAVSPQGTFADGAARLDGSRVEEPRAWGKHLVLCTDREEHLHVHLGMHGKLLRSPDPVRPPLPQSRLRLSTADVAWDLVAPSTCELLDGAQLDRLVAGLGPDPLRQEADRDAAVHAVLASPRPVGVVLLDQSVVAGVGNVFRNEALHEVGVHPATPAHDLTRDQVEQLWDVVRRVYKQEHCRDCGAPVQVIRIGGRTACLCPTEQPDPSRSRPASPPGTSTTGVP